MSTVTVTEHDSPFDILTTNVAFWRSYNMARPAPSEDFLLLVDQYHKSHGGPRTGVAHDVGTGPGNVAERLLRYYNHVVGSDVNDEALAAAPALIGPEEFKRMTFVKAAAEALGSASIPEGFGVGKNDLVLVSECMPLLDVPKALQSFHALLRPGGTLAIYFYSRPIFVDGDTLNCNAIYKRIATRICTFVEPVKGSPVAALQERASEVMSSWLDNIAIPAEAWEDVVRRKWNYDYPLSFISKEAHVHEPSPVDRRGEGELTTEVIDRKFWAGEWDVERVKAYLSSVYVNYPKKAGERYSEVEEMFTELEAAMGGAGARRKVTFPVSLIMATKK